MNPATLEKIINDEEIKIYNCSDSVLQHAEQETPRSKTKYILIQDKYLFQG